MEARPHASDADAERLLGIADQDPCRRRAMLKNPFIVGIIWKTKCSFLIGFKYP